ncbi:MAG: hypothetical protein ACP5HM_12300 [Anaerolineae bacterium]
MQLGYLVLVVSLSAYLLLDRAYDDPFITYRYADNLRHRLGFVYNPGQRILSTTTPLYTLLLAVLGHIWTDLPQLSNLLSAINTAVSGLLLFHLGRGQDAPLSGMTGALLFPCFPLILRTFGSEICFYITWVLAAFLLYIHKHPLWAMLPAALVTLTRADGVLVVSILGLDTLLRERRFPLRMALLYGAFIAPWYLFSWFYFGSPVPVTLMAKQHQATMAISEGFARGFLTILAPYLHKPLYWLHGGLFTVGLIYAIKHPQWRCLLGWGSLYFLSYTLLGVSRYFWYYAPLVPVITIVIGLGIQRLNEQLLIRRWATWQRWSLLVFLLTLMLLPQIQEVRQLSLHNDPRFRVYRATGRWLAAHTPKTASVGTLEVGIIGYYAQRPMIDFAGLLQPEVSLQMQRETTYQDTAIWAVRRYSPDYLVLNPEWFPRLMDEMVTDACIAERAFSAPDYPGILQVYRCHWINVE